MFDWYLDDLVKTTLDDYPDMARCGWLYCGNMQGLTNKEQQAARRDLKLLFAKLGPSSIVRRPWLGTSTVLPLFIRVREENILKRLRAVEQQKEE